VVLWAEGAQALLGEPAALMVQNPGDDRALAAAAAAVEAVVVGPGLGRGPAAMAVVETLARFARGLVVDADGLSAFADDPHALLRHGREGLVLTPHGGEFARLFPDLAAEGGDLIARTRAAAQRASCVVVHKGATTVIADPDGRVVVNRHASPYLASAGTGDVLAGVIAGLIAQGMAPFWAAAAGVWLHGDAGRALGPGLIADDVVEGVVMSLRRLGAGVLTGTS
jgi:NAD(P)H-hydrate epimerase